MSGALSVHCTPKEDIFETRHCGRVKDTELPAATIAVVTDIHGQVEIGAALPLVSGCAVSDAGAPDGWCPNGVLRIHQRLDMDIQQEGSQRIPDIRATLFFDYDIL